MSPVVWLLVLPLLVACEASPTFRGAVMDPPRPAPELEATNWDGRAFDLVELRGRVAILFFGYASCPDVCPLTMSRMKQLYARLEQDATDVAVVFVSVDPERDSVERLKAYVPAFDPRFYGLHLEEEALERTTAGFDVVVRRQSPRSPGGYYAVDHTGTLFLVDADGMLRVQHPHDAPIEDLESDVRLLLGARS